MLKQTEQMNNLYHDLFANSPKTVTMDLTPDMGVGSISQIVTKQGAVFSDWKMEYHVDMDVHGLCSDEFVQIMFCMKEGVSWCIDNKRNIFTLNKGESCIYRGHGKVEYISYKKGKEYLFKNVKIPVTYFRKLLSTYFETAEIEAYEQKLLTEMSKIKITPYMEHIFGELKDSSRFRGGLGYLFLESKIYELLSVYLSEVLELNILEGSRNQLSGTDRDSLVEVKRIIDAQIAYAPGCEELAKRVNISVSKLAKGFQAMYGISVHAYIIEQRLEKAASMILESDKSINQIAAEVGYFKSSNFAAAFKKKYGVLPSRYKEENTPK